MLKIKFIILLFLLLFFSLSLLFFVSCGITNQGSNSNSHLFFTEAQKTVPVFKPSSLTTTVQKKIKDLDWSSGTPLYAVYYSLREYITVRDEGTVDRSNIYKLLYDVDTIYSSMIDSGVTVPVQVIVPPFEELPTITADKVFNDLVNNKAIALKKSTDLINSIISWIFTESAYPNKQEYGIATLTYNTDSSIVVDMVYSVDYDIYTPISEYNLRCHLEGNPATHAFQFKYIINDNKLIAKGISRGSGNYMLIKYLDGSTIKYIVVPAEVNEDFFLEQLTSPTAIYTNPDDLPALVADYKNWVVNEDFFENSDLLLTTEDLNKGNLKQGTIFINFSE